MALQPPPITPQALARDRGALKISAPFAPFGGEGLGMRGQRLSKQWLRLDLTSPPHPQPLSPKRGEGSGYLIHHA